MAFAPGSSRSVFGFDPRSIPGCQTWLDASDSNTITYSSGSNVSIWKDKAPYGNNARRLQGTPIRVSNAMNGLPAMYLDGSNATSAAFTGTCPPNVTNQLTVFAVFTVDSGVQDSGRLFSLMYPDYQNPNSMAPLVYNTGANTLRVERNSSGYNATSNALTFGTPTLAACTVNGAATTIHMNGTQILSTSTVSSNLAYTYYTIGCFGQARGVGDNGVGPWNGYVWKGYVGEIILYSNALSTAQRQQVEGYLAWKWGIKTSSINSPTSIGGLALWLDAADASTLTLSGSNITSWNDKSGNGNNATATGTPTYNTAGLNSRPATAFNGSCYFQGNVSITGQTLTCFAVGSFVNSGGGDQRFVSLAATGQADWNSASRVAAIFNQGSTTTIASYRNQPATFPRHSHSYGTPFIACSVYDGTNGYIYVNGLPGNVQASYASAGTFAISKYCIGEQVSVTGEIIRNGGFVSEVLTYTTALTTVQRQQVEGYLSKKWGVSLVMSLPFTHPFYSIRPGLRTFRPIDIDGCALWLDGADSSTIFTDTAGTTRVTADGNTIGSWRDKSTNAYLFAQATAGSRPTYKTAILNGQSITRWNGTSTGLQSSTTLPFYTSASSGGSFFFVFMVTDNTTQRFLMTYQNQTSGTFCVSESEIGCPTGNVDTGNFGIHQGCGKANVALNQVTTNQYMIMNLTLLSSGTAPANTTIFKNGTSASMTAQNGGFYSGTTYPFANNARYLNIGYRVPVGVYPIDCWLAGDIAEIIWYQTPLTTAQRQQVEGYLANKWKITIPTVGVSSTTPSLTNCKLWLDGADILGTGAPAPATITTWADKSGTSNTVTANSLSAGQAIASSPMGPFMNGVSYFSITGGLVGSIVNVPFVIFVVETLAVSVGTPYFFGNEFVPNPATNNALHLGYRNSGNFTFAFYGNDIEVYQAFSNAVTRVWAFYMPSSGNRTARLNGSIVGTGNTTRLGNFNSPVIGRAFSSYDNAYYGTISEILVYNADIGVPAIQTVESYLMAKWQPGTLVPKFTIPAGIALPFSPLQISGSCLWLDANDPAGTGVQPSAGALATWTDKSGSSNHMTAAGTTPTFSNVPPGAVTFGGAGYYSKASAVFSNFYTAFFVYKQTAAAGPLYTTGASSGSNGLFPNEAGTTYFTRGDSTWYTVSSPFTSNVTNLAGVSFSSNAVGSNQSLFYNGSNVVTTTQANTITYTNLLIGSRQSGGTQYFTGSIYEVLAYGGTLTTNERQRVEGYLAQKWKV